MFSGFSSRENYWFSSFYQRHMKKKIEKVCLKLFKKKKKKLKIGQDTFQYSANTIC